MWLHVETIIVVVIVAIAGFFVGRSVWRAARQGGVCSGCSDAQDCPALGNPEKLIELGKIDQCGPASFDCLGPASGPSQPKTTITPDD
ncbi:MAG: FeoB-associated Cys-rich membrane protein [bacterium]|nr:FeoB-associated Cys-rich membrane protein [bacterium]